MRHIIFIRSGVSGIFGFGEKRMGKSRKIRKSLCVLVLGTHLVLYFAFYWHCEDIVVGPHNFKGLFNGWDLVLMVMSLD